MKTTIYTIILTTLLFAACEDGIDPITPVAQGTDASAPVVTIKYPTDGASIRVREDIATLKIEIDVSDDIEIANIALMLDGAKITEYANFKDYRHAVETYVYDRLTNGQHTLTVEAADLSGKKTSASSRFEKIEPYAPVYGEMFYMPFDGDYLELVSIVEATKVGAPSFAGQAYSGAPDAYVTFKTADLAAQLGNEFSAAFRYRLNVAPDRSGILTISPDDAGKSADQKNNRTSGIRLFREGSATAQTLKLNVGDGSGDTWFDGGDKAAIPTTGWVHIAFTISPSECVVYINGEVVSQGESKGVSWNGCDIISIASGAPRFTEWGHLSDNSQYDELRLFNKALTKAEVQSLLQIQ